MTDIGWDFTTNDLVVENGDFFVQPNVSEQNGLLLLLKSAVNIYAANWGVAIEELYANVSQDYLEDLAAEGASQIQDDGATSVEVTVGRDSSGKLVCEVSCEY